MGQLLPSEIINEIFGKSSPSPKNLRYFSKYMSKKTKSKMLNCREIIKTGNLSEIKRLKFFEGATCTHDDMLYAAKKGYSNIVKYINNVYPNAKITYDDIYNAVINREKSSDFLKILLENKRFNISLNDYLDLFGAIIDMNQGKMRILLDFKPITRRLKLSEIFIRPLTIYIPNLSEYVRKLLRVGVDDISIDQRFITYALNLEEDRLVSFLINNYSIDYNSKLLFT